MSAADTENDIVIVGAGPIGLAAALRLADQGHRVRIIDAKQAAEPSRDSRILALSHGSRQLLETLGAWPSAVTPIETIHVSQRGSLGRTELHHAEYGLPALGYVLRASILLDALMLALHARDMQIEYDSRVESMTPDARRNDLTLRNAAGERREISGALALCCEGRVDDEDSHALVSHDYGQHALLLRATPLRPHGNVARERFTPQGPIALLPLAQDYAVVWTVSPEQLAEFKALPDDALLERLHAAYGGSMRLAKVRDRSSYPLALRLRKTTVSTRTVWLGNAAQTLHPVAGQGFNLGLRDVWDFAESVRNADDPGAAEVLARYARRRQPDRWGTAGFTDGLVRLFSNEHSLLAHTRGAGLLALGLVPPLRHFVAKRMIFGARAWP
jgi:2-octaprenyl-6-methoxyphenol hydroxylase